MAPRPLCALPVPTVLGERVVGGIVAAECLGLAEPRARERVQPRVDLGAKGIFYRVQAGPIADGNVAERSCAALKARHVGCLVVKP